MKNNHLAIIVAILVLVAISFLMLSRQKTPPRDIAEAIDCQTQKIDPSIYSLAGNTSLIGAFISFNTTSLSDEQKMRLTEIGAKVYYNTFLIDYVYAEIPTNGLCDLANEEFVVSVFTPQENTNL